jgi:hypothetical protein
MAGFIYIASKAVHGGRWQELRATGYPIMSTWIDEYGPGQTKSWSDLYARAVREASTAKALIVYCETGEILKGALVEVGAALGAGVPVFAVGCEHQNFCHHPLVTRCASLKAALADALQEATRFGAGNSQLPWSASGLADALQEATRFGRAGVRDPENPCEGFVPGEPERGGGCDGDGHYMCRECTKYEPEPEDADEPLEHSMNLHLCENT